MVVLTLTLLSLLPDIGVALTAVARRWNFTPLPLAYTTEHLAEVWSNRVSLLSIENSVIYSACSTALDLLLGLTIAWLVPTVGLLISSFRPQFLQVTTGWWSAFSNPTQFTIDNYTAMLEQSNLGQAFFNSFMIAIPATVLPVTIGAFAAYAFAWMNFPGRNYIFLALVGLLAVPLQLTFIPVLHFYVQNLHWTTDNLEAIGIPGLPWVPLWLAHAGYGLPFSIYLLANFFRALPSDLFESAEIDGAGTLTVFFRLVMPLSVPAIASLVIFQFLWVWNDLLVALIYVGSSAEVAPMTVNLANLTTSLGAGSNLLTAAGRGG